MAENLLKVRKLVKHYPLKAGKFYSSDEKIHALNSVSFDLDKKQTLGIVGESGCGKTTLAKTMLGIIKPDSGHLYIETSDNDIELLEYLEQEYGKDAMKEAEQLRKKIDFLSYEPKRFREQRMKMQYIFQDPYMSLDPKMMIKDIITEPLLSSGKIRKKEALKKAEKILDIIGISAKSAYKYPHEFSGGQRQRISIGRAISANPLFIVCDEPVSSLDVSIQSQILNLLIDIQKELGVSYLFIAHNISVVLYMSDIVSVMYTGRIAESASSEELYTNPLHPYTKLLMSVIPEIGKNKKIFEKRRTGEIPSLINLPKGCTFYERCPIREEICREKIPPLKQINANHACACHMV